MIVALDTGNSNIKVGVYKSGEIVQYARFSTDPGKTSDEYAILLMNLFTYAGLDKQAVEGMIISSVVPSMNYTLEHTCQTFFGFDPLFVGPGIKTGMNIRYDNPRELGSDRLVTAIAAYDKYSGPCIVIDFGTATTFSVVAENGDFIGGAILPGLKVSTEALVRNTSKLPVVELKATFKAIGRNTVENMQSGIINSYVGGVEYLIRKMRRELENPKARVVSTGGMARLIREETNMIDENDTNLTLDGLRIVYERNQAHG